MWTGSAWLQTNEVHFIYDGNLVIQERNGNNLPLVTYTRGTDLSGTMQGAGGIGGLLARTDNSRLLVADPLASAYYHCDGNGNVTCLINPYQQIAAKYLYDPYGSTLAQSGPLADANTYRFSSKEWNANSGLYYYLYRFYDPNLQRWLNRDPVGELGFEVFRVKDTSNIPIVTLMSFFEVANLYEYVSDDPVQRFDILGLADACAQLQQIVNYALSIGDLALANQAMNLYNQICRPPPVLPPGGEGYERNPWPDPTLNRVPCPSPSKPQPQPQPLPPQRKPPWWYRWIPDPILS